MPKIRAETIEAHKKLTRNSLLDAATKSFVSDGFAGTSLSAIADLAGIARTTLYEYFDSKDELLIAIVEERVPPTLQALVDEIAATDPLERLEEIFRRCHRLAADFLDITLVFFRVGRELPPGLSRPPLGVAEPNHQRAVPDLSPWRRVRPVRRRRPLSLGSCCCRPARRWNRPAHPE